MEITINTEVKEQAIEGLNQLAEEGILKRIEPLESHWDAGRIYFVTPWYDHYGSVVRAVATIMASGHIEWAENGKTPRETLEDIVRLYNERNESATQALGDGS